MNAIALSGIPRSGTTLCCKLLNDVHDCVALFEPMVVQELDAGSASRAVDQVKDFFLDSRRALLTERRAISYQQQGVVPDNPFGERRDGQRQHLVQRDWLRVDKPLSKDFTLVIKHNAAFTALLPELARAFPVFALIRNPLAVLASWNTVDLPVRAGFVPAAERLDPGLERRLRSLGEVLERQIAILEWFFERYAHHVPRERLVRYEDVVASGGQRLFEALGLKAESQELQSRNSSALYRDRDLELVRLHERLSRCDGALAEFYPRTALDEALMALTADKGSA